MGAEGITERQLIAKVGSFFLFFFFSLCHYIGIRYFKDQAKILYISETRINQLPENVLFLKLMNLIYQIELFFEMGLEM